MALTIDLFQRGGTPMTHAKLRIATEAMVRAALGPRVVETIHLRVHLRATKLAPGTHAEVKILTNGSRPQRTFNVILQRDFDLQTQIEAMAHEVVHIAQVVEGRLQYRWWKTDGQMHARWEGQDLGPKRDLPYWTQPWEVEARAQEGALAQVGVAAAVRRKAA